MDIEDRIRAALRSGREISEEELERLMQTFREETAKQKGFPQSVDELLEQTAFPQDFALEVIEAHDRIDFEKIREPLEGIMHVVHPYESYLELERAFPGDKRKINLLAVELEGALRAAENYKNRGIAPEIYTDTFKCFTRFVNEYREMHGEWGFGIPGWAYRQINLSIFRLGEFEFEFIQTSGVDAKRNVGVHIPSGCRLTADAFMDSLKQLNVFINSYCPMFKDAEFGCHSWLLAPALKELLSEGSNIRSFADMFDIKKVYEEDRDFMNFLFKSEEDTPIEQLPEKTSLQRKAKQHLYDYGRLGAAYGVLKEELICEAGIR